MILSFLPSSVLEHVANIILFFCNIASPISKTYFDFLDARGFIFYQSQIASIFVYAGLMTTIFYLRRFITGDHKTNMITEFSSTHYEVRTGPVSKVIIFAWNMFMFAMSLVLSIVMTQGYHDISQALSPPINMFSLFGFIDLTIAPILEHVSFSLGNVFIPAITMLHFVMGTKFIEWIDTAINMSMGRSVIFLHFWHHATIVAAFSSGPFSTVCIPLIIINSWIHVVMYLYYALSVVGSLRPHLNMFKIFITVTQIIQFFIGIGVGFIHLLPAYREAGMIFYNQGPDLINNVMKPWGYGHVVGDTMRYHIATELFVISYLILFVQFFYKTYKMPKPTKPVNGQKKILL